MKILQIIFALKPQFFSKDLKYLFDTVLGQDGMIFDDVGWWSRFNKGKNGVDNFGIGLEKIMEGTGTNNQVAPSHGYSIGYFIILFDGGRIH